MVQQSDSPAAGGKIPKAQFWMIGVSRNKTDFIDFIETVSACQVNHEYHQTKVRKELKKRMNKTEYIFSLQGSSH
jgi:hypothetical protein